MKTSIDVLTEYTENGWGEYYFGISGGTCEEESNRNEK